MAEASAQPHVIVIAGPNGAGKSTAAPDVLQGALGASEFVNADVIARGLSAFDQEKVAVSAGKIMLRRLDELAAARASFAFETTLSSRSFARWIKRLCSDVGYRFHLAYIWLPSADMVVARVAARVRAGGHHIPGDVARRRYARSLWNFLHLYRPIADTWVAYDGGTPGWPTPIAAGAIGGAVDAFDGASWDQINRSATDESPGSD